MKKIVLCCVHYVRKNPLVIRYGVLLALSLILLKTLEYQLFSFRLRQDMYVGLVALTFLIVGLGVAFAWSKTSPRKIKEETSPPILTAKEIKLLHGLKEGLSNQQLADASFVSINTIKTQLKALYKKLQVSNRSQAVQTAQQKSLF